MVQERVFYAWEEAPEAIRERGAEGWYVTGMQGVRVDEGRQIREDSNWRLVAVDLDAEEAIAALESWPRDEDFGVYIDLARPAESSTQ